MVDNYASFKNVSREVFDRVIERVNNHEDRDVRHHTTVYYNGTNLRGDLAIEFIGGYARAYKKVLQIVSEEIIASE